MGISQVCKVCAGCVLALSIVIVPQGAWAAVGEESPRGELPISLQDFPRRLRAWDPAIKPDQAIKLGALRVHPSYMQQIEYDDNIRLSENDASEDVIFTERPAIIAEMDVAKHLVQAGYGMEIVNFVKDGEENAVNHLAYGRADLNFDNLTVTVEDTFERSTNRTFSENSARDRAVLNVVDVLARYDRPMWVGEAGWIHNTVNHRTARFEPNDYEEDVLGALFGYKIQPKTIALIENNVGLVYYDTNLTNADQTYWQIQGGFRGDPTEDLSFTLKAGYQNRGLSERPAPGSQEEFSGFVSDNDLIFRLTDKDTFRMGYTRLVRTSTFSTNSFYRQDKLAVSYRKRLGRKWLVTPNFSWQFHDYPEESTVDGAIRRRDDHFFVTGVELRYEFQDWLSAGAAYRFRARNSNFGTFDYENNRFVFDVSFLY